MQFSEFNLPAPVMQAIHELGYTEPTGVQEKSIPLIMGGKDVIAHSQTGSGKTAAFGLPLVSMVPHGKGIHALVLTPTRELCMQVSDAIRGFAKKLPLRVVPVFGGVGLGAQLSAVRTADIVVATPGRLLDLMQRGTKLHTVVHLVLDEADRMLDMGFIEDVEKIIKNTSKDRQTMLFSATLSPRLRSLVNKYMNNPIPVQAKTHVDTSLLTETMYAVSQQDKFSLLVHLLKNDSHGIAIVFCGTRRSCDKVSKQLRLQQIDAIAIHGGLTQSKRMYTIEQLHKKGSGILVATDVASRGLHIDNISHVYNYELPQTSDDYVHRIGRTARAGNKGDAVALITPADVRDFRAVERHVNRKITQLPLPTFEKIVQLHTAEKRGDFHGGGGRPRFGGGRNFSRGGGGGRFGGRPQRFGRRDEGRGERSEGGQGGERREGGSSERRESSGHGDGGQRRFGKPKRQFWKRN